MTDRIAEIKATNAATAETQMCPAVQPEPMPWTWRAFFVVGFLTALVLAVMIVAKLAALCGFLGAFGASVLIASSVGLLALALR